LIEISIAGMNCQHCVRRVRESLAALNGVTRVDVDLERQTAHLQANADLSDALLGQTLAEQGYKATAIVRT